MLPARSSTVDLASSEETPLLPGRRHGRARRRRRRETAALLSVAALAVASLGAAGNMVWRGEVYRSSQQDLVQQQQQRQQRREAPTMMADQVRGWRERAKQALQATGGPLMPPNIIFILADDLGFNDVGWAGDDFVGLTPTLDALKETGVELTSYYTQQLCTPARAALLTGRYPFKIGMQSVAIGPKMVWGLPPENIILPEFLAGAASYRSHMIGKWHLGLAFPALLPTSRGFTTSYGMLGGQADYVNHTSLEVAGYTDFLDSWANGGATTVMQRNGSVDGMEYACVLDKSGNYSATLFTDRALQIADEWNDNGRDAPLFLYMSYQNPHAPSEKDPYVDYTPISTQLDAITNTTRQLVGQNVFSLDKAVGELLAGLEQRGVLENSVIVFTSDNGGCEALGQSNYPLRGAKNYTFEGGSRVRAFATSPLFPDSTVNTTYDGIFHVTDWVPTLLEMAAPGWSKTEAAELLDGINQLPVLVQPHPRPSPSTSISTSTATSTSTTTSTPTSTSGDNSVQQTVADPRTELIYNLQQDLDEDGNPLLLYGAIREGDWKYIMNEDCLTWYDFGDRYSDDTYTSQCTTFMVGCVASDDRQSYLFNLKDDPFETTDLSADQPDLVAHFEARLQQIAATEMVLDVYNDNSKNDENCIDAWVAAGGCIVPWTTFNPESYHNTQAPMTSPGASGDGGA